MKQPYPRTQGALIWHGFYLMVLNITLNVENHNRWGTPLLHFYPTVIHLGRCLKKAMRTVKWPAMPALPSDETRAPRARTQWRGLRCLHAAGAGRSTSGCRKQEYFCPPRNGSRVRRCKKK